jgi:Putative metallopeptidase domain
MDVNNRIKKAHIAIMQHKKFCAYSGVIACGKVEVTTSVPTAVTDGWDVWYNPDFIEANMPTDPELRFLVLHEATHKAYRHMAVWKSLHTINAQLANVAADYFVNGALVDTDDGEGFIKMPSKSGIKPKPEYRGWSVLQIFNDLMKDPENGSGGGGMDDHDWEGNAASNDPEAAQEQANVPYVRVRCCVSVYPKKVPRAAMVCSVTYLHPRLTGVKHCVSLCKRLAAGVMSRRGLGLTVGS